MSSKIATSLEEFLKLTFGVLCAVDRDGYFRSVSRGDEKISAYKSEGFEDELFLNYVAFQDVDATRKFTEKIVKEKEIPYFENRSIHKNEDLVIDELHKIFYYKMAIRQLFHHVIGKFIKYPSDDSNPNPEVKGKENEKEFQLEIIEIGLGIDENYIISNFPALNYISQYVRPGLGLAICEKLLERYRSNIWVDFQVGKGSSFFFSLHKIRTYA